MPQLSLITLLALALNWIKSILESLSDIRVYCQGVQKQAIRSCSTYIIFSSRMAFSRDVARKVSRYSLLLNSLPLYPLSRYGLFSSLSFACLDIFVTDSGAEF